MKRKKILSFIISTVLVVSSSLLINSTVQASNTKKTTVSSSNNLKTNTTVRTGTITTSSLNVRISTSLNSKVLSTLKGGTSIEIVDSLGDWFKIKLGSNYGYVSKKYVKIDTLKDSKSNASTNNNNFKKGIITISRLNVRNNAALTAKILTTLDKNISVEIVDTIGSWYKIKLGSSYGYVFKEYIKTK